LAKRRQKKSLKKLIDEAAREADKRVTSLGSPLVEELQQLVWHEDEIVIFSPDLVDLPSKVYKRMASGLKRRGFQVKKLKAIELRNDRLISVNRYLVGGKGVAEEAEVFAKMNNLSVILSI